MYIYIYKIINILYWLHIYINALNIKSQTIMKWIHRFFSSHEPSFFYKFSDATPRWEIGSRKHRPKGISENRWADQEKTLFRRPSFQVSVALLLILFTLQLQQPFFSSIARLPSSLQFQPSVVRCFFHERNLEKFFFYSCFIIHGLQFFLSK